MEYIFNLGSALFGTLIPFLFVLTIVVFFHELGHFLVGRWCGVGVKVFSIGFGPEIFGMTDRWQTRWRLSAIPLGGYVKFEGDDNAASVPDRNALSNMDAEAQDRSFASKSVSQRAAIVVAGPLANFILTIAIFAVMFSLYGRPISTPTVDEVVPDSAAAEAGFMAGDLVVSIDGSKIESFSDIQRAVSASAGTQLSFDVDRGGRAVTLLATPRMTEIKDMFGGTIRQGLLGIKGSAKTRGIKTYTVPQALWAGVTETWFIISRTGQFLWELVSGRQSADQMGGPIMIAQISGQAATLGFAAVINLAAILSVSIGLLNLFPIPLLDGGHLAFYAAEAAMGRPLSERAQDIGYRIGFAIVIMLMVFVTWNDIHRLASF
jgi:regulator of sigma E protease